MSQLENKGTVASCMSRVQTQRLVHSWGAFLACRKWSGNATAGCRAVVSWCGYRTACLLYSGDWWAKLVVLLPVPYPTVFQRFGHLACPALLEVQCLHRTRAGHIAGWTMQRYADNFANINFDEKLGHKLQR